MFQSVSEWHVYLMDIRWFSYHTVNRMWFLNRKNERRLEMSMKKDSAMWLPVLKSISTSVISATIIAVPHSVHKCCLLWRINLWTLRNQENMEEGPSLGGSRYQRLLLIRAALYLSLPVTTGFTTTATGGKMVQGEKQQRSNQKTIFQDFFPDAFPLDSSVMQSLPPETSRTVLWMLSFWILLCFLKYEMDAT